jgi:hypothetical protein
MKDRVEKYRNANKNEPPAYDTEKFSQTYNLLVKEGMRLNHRAPKAPGKRGRAKQSKARLLLDSGAGLSYFKI